ncbi:hypothetical protein TNCV_4459811 [Trichonephila clavipes]|nr:hypothetical protein TNCV_4459811 [Trichonephila clavipes]
MACPLRTTYLQGARELLEETLRQEWADFSRVQASFHFFKVCSIQSPVQLASEFHKYVYFRKSRGFRFAQKPMVGNVMGKQYGRNKKRRGKRLISSEIFIGQSWVMLVTRDPPSLRLLPRNDRYSNKL